MCVCVCVCVCVVVCVCRVECYWPLPFGRGVLGSVCVAGGAAASSTASAVGVLAAKEVQQDEYLNITTI